MGKMTATAAIQPAPLRAQLRCEGCGATVDAACDCGLPYVRAGEVAAKAIEANPEMSNNAIAKDIGVSEPTVRRIRGSLKDEPGTTKRIGKDGKSYPAMKPKGPARKSTKGPDEQQYLDRVEKAIALATVPYTGKVSKEAVELARGVATAWTEHADKLEGQLKALN
jgi:hypothetical protein